MHDFKENQTFAHSKKINERRCSFKAMSSKAMSNVFFDFVTASQQQIARTRLPIMQQRSKSIPATAVKQTGLLFGNCYTWSMTFFRKIICCN